MSSLLATTVMSEALLKRAAAAAILAGFGVDGARSRSVNSIERMRATYNLEPVDHLVRKEFYIWGEAIERWKTEGMPEDADQAELFGFEPGAGAWLGMLGWCEPQFVPGIESKLIESTDDYEIVLDGAGRTVKFFKHRRHGFMPTYLKHAVTCDKDWEEDIAPLLSPDTPQRWENFDKQLADMSAGDKEGKMIVANGVGGYMYLRSLVGPEDICYMFVDNPKLVHKMMQAWLDLAEVVIARFQEHLQIDELFLAEDICYNHGLLISPDMVREFILPYYEQLLSNIRSRQEGGKRLFFQVDTDGNCDEALELYHGIGLDVMSPFEVAAGNDVVEIARKYPDLVISGGIDKRVLAAGKDAIEQHLNHIIPFMVDRGGYIPTCDHGVPDDVSYENYLHYRRRIMELDH